MNFLTLVVVNHFSCGRPASPISRFGQRIDDVDLELVPATLHGAGNLNAEPTSKTAHRAPTEGPWPSRIWSREPRTAKFPLHRRASSMAAISWGSQCVRLAMLRLRTCE